MKYARRFNLSIINPLTLVQISRSFCSGQTLSEMTIRLRTVLSADRQKY